jgi:TRAP-type C4-dicarboxylate transport system permease small subunit
MIDTSNNHTEPSRPLEACENALAKVGGVCVLLLASLVIIGVLSRLLQRPILFVEEVSGYLMVGLVFLMAPQSLSKGHFIRATFVIDRLGGRAHDWVVVVGNILSSVFILVVSYYSWVMIVQQFKAGSHAQSELGTPIYLTQVSVVIGLTLITARLVIEVLDSVKIARNRK